jgi:hypothetical protein
MANIVFYLPADCNNSPEWNRTTYEIANPGKPYFWTSSWTFSTF